MIAEDESVAPTASQKILHELPSALATPPAGGNLLGGGGGGAGGVNVASLS